VATFFFPAVCQIVNPTRIQSSTWYPILGVCRLHSRTQPVSHAVWVTVRSLIVASPWVSNLLPASLYLDDNHTDVLLVSVEDTFVSWCWPFRLFICFETSYLSDIPAFLFIHIVTTSEVVTW